MSISKDMPIYYRRKRYKKSIYAPFIISFIIIIFSSWASARIIWKIGEDDASNSGFGLPGSSGSDPALNQEVVPFSPPKDPNSHDWRSFPCKIWPPEASYRQNPKEIHIIYDYPKDFRCPMILRIKARSAVRNFTQGLVVIKDGVNLSQDLGLPEIYPDPNAAPEIPVGNIRKGLHEENTLIIKNISLTSDNHSIHFDYLELDDQDQDGDGSQDCEEIEGDMDKDETENIMDPDTVTLLIQSKDSTKRKRITLDLKETNGRGPLFKGLILLDTDSPDIIEKPPEGIFFPYGLFRAHIDIPGETDTLMISVYTPEDQMIYNTVQFYLYKENLWRSEPVEILSQNALHLSVGLDRDQGVKEEGSYNKEFIITGGFAYPEGLNIDLERTGLCFIKSTWN